MDQPMIRLGTSAFTAAGWEGSFYPEGMKPADYLSYYAKHFNSVELDNTFYRAPSKSTVEGWARKTPDSRVGGGALTRWPPSAAQTARADWLHAAFTKSQRRRE